MPTAIAARRPARRLPALACSATVSVGYLGCALALAYLAVETPLVERLSAGGTLGASPRLSVPILWALVLVAPAGLGVFGLARLGQLIEALVRRLPDGPVRSIERQLPRQNYLFGPVRLPEGRLIPELVVGPHGVAIFEALPPRGASRHANWHWEVRVPDGRWVAIENPLDQATRDAERVRRWLAMGDRDFVVKVHAAVIAPDHSLPRTPTCAVITRDEVRAYLAALPAQRSLTGARLAGLVGVLERTN